MKLKAGITLIEVVVVAFMSAVVTGVIVAIILDSWKEQLSQEAIGQAQLESRFVTNEIVTVARESLGVLESLTASGNSYQSNSSSLILRLASINTDGEAISGTDYFIFRRNPTDNSITERIIIADPLSARSFWPSTLSLAKSTGALVFTYYGPGSGIITPQTRSFWLKAFAQSPPSSGGGGSTVADATKIGILHRSVKTVYLRTITREFEQVVSLRNKP